MWLSVSLLCSAVAAPAALVMEPLAPALGLRLAPSDRVQLDLSVGPELSWSNNRLLDEASFGGGVNGSEQELTRVTIGAALHPSLRFRLADAPTAATASVGGWGSAARLWDTSSMDEEDTSSDPGSVLSAGGWVGAGLSHRWGGRWSVGADVEVATVSWTRSVTAGVFQGFSFESTSSSLQVAAVSGAHLWIARRFGAATPP